MASSHSGLLNSVSCGVCLQQYDNKTHVPKILPCQHTFCQSCLTSIHSHNGDGVNFECPVCRKKYNSPAKRFITNKVALEVVEELLKDTSSIMKCSKHSGRESVLVCIDCLEGLCITCMKDTRKTSNCHHEHQLEELNHAKSQLWKKFEMHVKAKQVNLQNKISSMNQSAYSVAEITKAEADINKMCNKLDVAITRWKEVQLVKIAEYKAEATKREGKIHAQMTNLQSLLRQENVNIVTLMTELKRGAVLWAQSPDLDSPQRNKYNLAERCNELSQKLHSELGSRESITSKLLQQEQASAQEEQLNPQQAKGCGSVTGEIELGALILGYIAFVCPFFFVFGRLVSAFEKKHEQENIKWRRHRDQAKQILLQMKPNLRCDFEELGKKLHVYMFITMLMCLLIALVVAIFQISSRPIGSNFVQLLNILTFWFVSLGLASSLLAFSFMYVCLNPGCSKYIVMTGWVVFESLPLEAAEKITSLLAQIQLRKSS